MCGVRTPLRVPIAAAVALLVALPPAASASQVTKQADTDDGNCTTMNCSLRDAVKYGPANDVIAVPAGTYHLTLNPTPELVVSHPLTIVGAPRSPTTITADGAHRVLEIPDAVASGPVTLRRITVTGGNGEQTGMGGGILNTSGKLLTLDHARVTGNNADYTNFANTSIGQLGGAGIYSDGPLTGTNSTIDHNTMTMHVAGSLNFTGGAGVYAQNGAVTLTNTEVRDNTIILSAAEAGSAEVEQNGGGGIFEVGVPSLTLNASTIAGNAVTVSGGDPNPHENGGGGIYALFGDVAATNSTLSGNTVHTFSAVVDNGGGGLYSAKAHATLASATVADNTASGSVDAGGGIYRYGGEITPRNTIIARNHGGVGANCLGDVSSQGHNLDSGNTCGLAGPGDKINVAKPFVGPLAQNGGPTRTQALLKGSPAINAGALCPKVDQRGHSRPRGRACDIGAVEADVPNVVTGGTSNVKTKSAKLKGTVNPNGFSTTYRFEFGKTTKYAKKTAAKSAGSGSTAKAIALKVSKLKPGTTYHYRLVATNAFGTTFGADKTFKTHK